MRSYSGRSCALTPEQLLALKSAYELHTANSPKRLAQRFGVSKQTIYSYLRARVALLETHLRSCALILDTANYRDTAKALRDIAGPDPRGGK